MYKDEVLACDDPEAFWEITGQFRDIEATEDDKGSPTYFDIAYDRCGADTGAPHPGELWTTWQYVYDADGNVDVLLCFTALGKPDPESDDRTPYIPDVGSCIDDEDSTWTVDCRSSDAVYRVVDVVEFDEPQELSEDEVARTAEEQCGDGRYHVGLVDFERLVTMILCLNDR
jgi:hypothetical protein